MNVKRRLHTERPTHRALDGVEACPGNRLDCASKECVVLLLRLAFDRFEAAEILSSMTGESAACALRVGALYSRLARFARDHTLAPSPVTLALSERLGHRALGVESPAMFEIASVWARRKESMDALSAAALLWLVARSPAPWLRKLETVIVEDLQYLAARSLTAYGPAVDGAAPRAETRGVAR